MLDEALRNAMSEIPNCVAMGAVDLSSGTMLAVEAVEQRSQEMLNVMTSAVTELFEAPLLQAFSEIYAPSPGEAPNSGKQFTELLLLNNFHHYLLLRGRKRTHLAVIVITTKETPVGLLMMKALGAMPNIENSV
jgi:hypothetical protein